MRLYNFESKIGYDKHFETCSLNTLWNKIKPEPIVLVFT